MERLNKARRSSKDVPSVDGTPRTSTVRSANLSRLKECLRKVAFFCMRGVMGRQE
ncbi:MAG: hypothetical protein HFI52_02490 [Lachnospiraceae bacterium]|nr:hypothetical protein [Lachnospiraceae bacterium]